MENGVLAKVDVTKRIESKSKYNKKLEKISKALISVAANSKEEKIAVMLVMEGWDAAGKGGAIKRVTEHLDPRGFQVNPIGAPAPHEKTIPLLATFLAEATSVWANYYFDRSWYGRVLVERVEGFATKEEWTRAYDEINDFENY